MVARPWQSGIGTNRRWGSLIARADTADTSSRDGQRGSACRCSRQRPLAAIPLAQSIDQEAPRRQSVTLQGMTGQYLPRQQWETEAEIKAEALAEAGAG